MDENTPFDTTELPLGKQMARTAAINAAAMAGLFAGALALPLAAEGASKVWNRVAHRNSKKHRSE